MIQQDVRRQVVAAYIEGEVDPFETEPSAEEVLAFGLTDLPSELLSPDEKSVARIPFAFTTGVFNVAGYLCLESPLENSYAKGVIIPFGDFRIDRHRPTLELSVELLKLRLGIDFKRQVLYWQVAEPYLKIDGLKVYRKWKWHGRNVICGL